MEAGASRPVGTAGSGERAHMNTSTHIDIDTDADTDIGLGGRELRPHLDG
jgi:hypothetical protein